MMMSLWAVLCLCGLATWAATDEELLSAVRDKDAEAVRRLLSRSSFEISQMWFVNADGSNSTMLHEALQTGHSTAGAEVLKLLLAAWPEGVHARDKRGRVPLHAACSFEWVGFGLSDRLEVVQLLLQLWPDGAKVADDLGRLPLHDAVFSGNLEAARLILNQWPAGVEVVDSFGRVPLHIAAGEMVAVDRDELLLYVQFRSIVSGDYLELVQLLVEAWPEGLTVADHRGRTPLYVAVEDGKLQVARWMFRKSTPPAYTREMPCDILMELACNTSEATQPWQEAARDLRCSDPELLLRPALQLWLDVCGGRPSYSNDFGALAERLTDREAKDEPVWVLREFPFAFLPRQGETRAPSSPLPKQLLISSSCIRGN